jgi:hypothetical protein
MTRQADPRTYALLADGSTIEIRLARPDDAEAVREMHASLSPDNAYFRFFSLTPARPIARRPGYAGPAATTIWRCSHYSAAGLSE